MTNLGEFHVDVEMMDTGKFNVYIAHEGNSGSHYENVTANKIGDLVADDIECIAEAYMA